MRKKPVTFNSRQGKYDLPLWQMPSTKHIKNNPNIESFPIRLLYNPILDEWRLDIGVWINKKPVQYFIGNVTPTLPSILDGLEQVISAIRKAYDNSKKSK